MKIDHETIGGEPAVRVTFGHWSWAGIFLILWLAGWTFACHAIASHLLSGPFRIQDLLFALPFFAGEIVVSCILLLMAFGRTAITFTRSGWTKFTGIGGIGRTRRNSFPPGCELAVDTTVTHGRRDRSTFARLVVKTAPDMLVSQVIWSSPDAAKIRTLWTIAREVVGGAASPVGPDMAAAPVPPEAGAGNCDRELLAGRPPRGIVVARDFEGRVSLTYRRVAWGVALVIAPVVSVLAATLWMHRREIPVPVLAASCVCLAFPLVQLAFALFGKRTLTLDHEEGETFTGIGRLGFRKRFSYGRSSEVRLADSNLFINGERMVELVIARPGGEPARICMGWPNAVKPYLAALVRHPEAVPVEMFPD